MKLYIKHIGKHLLLLAVLLLNSGNYLFAQSVVFDTNPDIVTLSEVGQRVYLDFDNGNGFGYSMSIPDGVIIHAPECVSVFLSGPKLAIQLLSLPENSGTQIVNITYNGATIDIIQVVITATGNESVSEDQNYVMESIILKEGITDYSSIGNLEVGERTKIVSYFDGLGRMSQQVNVGGSPNKRDIITPVAYDAFGREAKKYLPYVKSTSDGKFVSNALTKQAAYYSNKFDGDGAYPFAETVFENSPLNRVLAQGAPGAAWQPTKDANNNPTLLGHTVKMDYVGNSADEVVLFELSNGDLVKSGYYEANRLYKTITKDENWTDQATDVLDKLHTTEEYKDKLGQVLLKRAYVDVNGTVTPLSTYYVYDDFGLLRYVIPPKANGDGSSITQETIDQLCYAYKYDSRKRMTYKKLPGAAPVLMVYDQWDRLVLTQDGQQRGAAIGTVEDVSDSKTVSSYDGTSYKITGSGSVTLTDGFVMKASGSDAFYLGQNPPSESTSNGNLWTFTKYDVFNRPVMTGEVTLTGTHEALQEAAMAATNRYEEFGSGNLKGYTNTAYPTNVTAEDLLTVTFYDNYNFSSLDEYNSHFEYTEMEDVSGYSFVLADGVNTKVKGQVTGSLTRVLGTQQWLLTATYYDSKYRVIQTISQNQLGNYTGFDVVSTSYDFVGQAMATLHLHNNGTTGKSTAKVMSYDHAGRLTAVDMSVDGAANQRVASNTYDELGQLQNKSLHGGIQQVDYTYNVRGWMTKINDPDKTYTQSEADDRLFRMQLLYTTDLDGGQGQFNGNIAAMKWYAHTEEGENNNPRVQRGYNFTYDALNRLTAADYREGSAYANLTSYDVPEIKYDLNGNITALKRYGVDGDDETSKVIDQLAYTYTGNQLQAVNDAISKDLKLGFIDGAEQAQEYAYDLNGNMTSDANKGITSVEYNQLNLPAKITIAGKGTIEYLYDAAGIKLEKLNITDTTTVITKYVGSYIYKEEYKNDSLISSGLDRILHDEGYISAEGTWHYFLRDHLGNTRVDFAVSGTTTASVQDYHYYPFGMDFTGLNNTTSDNKLKYNGKELQDDHGLDWYDYGARFYDAQIGSFHTVDPHAENYFSWNPYTYVYNNPINGIDPDGRDGILYIQVMLNESGDPTIDKETMAAIKTRMENKFADMGVDAAVEIHYSNEVMSREEFENREGAHEADSYILIGGGKQLNDVVKSNWEENDNLGWNNVSSWPSSVNGTSTDKLHYVNADNMKQYQGESIYESSYESVEEKTYLTIMHEDGHPKFKDHSKNHNGYSFTGKGVPGHVNGTIMAPTPVNDTYDQEMKNTLLRIHGSSPERKRQQKEGIKLLNSAGGH